MKITDAKFRVVRGPRPEGWTEEQYEEWLTMPWWRRYRITFDPWIMVTSGALGAASALRHWLQ